MKMLSALIGLLVCGPAEACRVALDVGHTLTQPGATSASGVGEFTYNQRLARAVQGALAGRGVATVVIGDDGAPLALLDRTRRAKAAGADAFLSLHHDSVQPRYMTAGASTAFRGYSVFVSADSARARESERFGRWVAEALRGAGFTPSLHHAEAIPGEGRPLLDPYLGLYRFDGLAVLRTATMPAVLLEAGIIVNPAEEEAIRTPAHLARLSQAVAAAVQRQCGAP